ADTAVGRADEGPSVIKDGHGTGAPPTECLSRGLRVEGSAGRIGKDGAVDKVDCAAGPGGGCEVVESPAVQGLAGRAADGDAPLGRQAARAAHCAGGPAEGPAHGEGVRAGEAAADQRQAGEGEGRRPGGGAEVGDAADGPDAGVAPAADRAREL